MSLLFYAGTDVKVQLRVPFADVLIGRGKSISYSHLVRCHYCNGTGRGRQPVARESLFGQISDALSRPFVLSHCAHCDGSGTVSANKQSVVKVPPGVVDGVTLRRRGEGNWAPGSPGDLVVEVAVDGDPRFQRKGLQIHSQVNISFLEAILGTRVFVETAEGGQWVYLRPGTQPGQEVHLAGKGLLLSNKGEGRGDIILNVNVVIPQYWPFSISKCLLRRYSHLQEKHGNS